MELHGRSGGPEVASGGKQPVCRVYARMTGKRTAERTRAGVRAVALCGALAPCLAGCVAGPLSALEPASSVTRSVASLWWIMASGTGLILLLMVGLAMLAIRRNPPRAPGHRGVRLLLLFGGIALPVTVIAALLAYTLRLEQAQWPPGAQAEASRAFHVDVIAHQWWWEARYPAATSDADAAAVVPRSINVLYVPAGVPVHVRIMATDVIHAFWAPRIAGKLDAVPGRVNQLRLEIDEPGEYAGVCAEYCGEGHAGMRFTLIAHPPDVLRERLAELAGEAR